MRFRAHNGKDYDEKTVVKSEAMKGIMGWIRLHPYNISQKAQIVVEHFRRYVSPLLNGKAKAIVVVGGRVEAVHWQLAIQKYIEQNNCKIGTIVAFAGEVVDFPSGPDPFTENSQTLNPTLRGRNIREAFDKEEFHILLVATKFQAGFDQPLLCGMYVDKRLAGIQAVQTLSRLNRADPLQLSNACSIASGDARPLSLRVVRAEKVGVRLPEPTRGALCFDLIGDAFMATVLITGNSAATWAISCPSPPWAKHCAIVAPHNPPDPPVEFR